MSRRSLLLVLGPLLVAGCRAPSIAAEPGLAHAVFFTLTDPAHAPELEDACRELAATTPGVLTFAVGPRVEDLARPVNDLDFHVAFLVVFEDRAAHDAYQTSPAHVALVERYGSGFAAVRVFDAAAGER